MFRNIHSSFIFGLARYFFRSSLEIRPNFMPETVLSGDLPLEKYIPHH